MSMDRTIGTDQGLSTQFSSEDAEVTFRSSEGTLFRIHRKELTITTGGFSPPPNADFSDIVYLTESDEILEILFQFVYPSMIPDLSSISFSKLDRLAEAAHKYQVYSAMDICSLYMSDAAIGQPIPVFKFAIRHGYPDIASIAAPLLIDEPLDELLESIPFSPREMIRWLRYHDFWTRCQLEAITSLSPDEDVDIGSFKAIVNRLCERLRSLQDLDAVFQSFESPEMRSWKLQIQVAVLRIPLFNELLDPQQDGCDIDVSPTILNVGDVSQITFLSSDGVTGTISTECVGLCAPLLLKATTSTPDGHLEEPNNVLSDIFRYISPGRHSNSLRWDRAHLCAMADAAEKYAILSAKRVVQYHMKKLTQIDPQSVFRYSVKCSDHALMNETARLVVAFSPSMVAAMLPGEFILSWIQYYDQWLELVRTAIRRQDIVEYTEVTTKTDRGPEKELTFKECQHCYIAYDISDIVSQLAEGPKALLRLDEILDPSQGCCSGRKREMKQWKDTIHDGIEAILPFTSFLS